MAETRKPARPRKATAKAAPRKAPARTTAAKSSSAKARPAPAKRKAAPRQSSRRTDSSGFEGMAKLIDHPLVADLLAVGAMAAVAAIADHHVKTRTGESDAGSSKAVKAAGKAAASAIGKRLLSEVDAVRKASSPTKRGSR